MLFRKREKRPTPPWLVWLMIGVVIYAMASSQQKGSPVQEAVEEASQNLKPSQLLPLEDYKKIFPSGNILRIHDVTTGSGMPALCGQEATIAYSAALPDGTKLADSASKIAPLTFRIGDGKALPAFEQGVIGMQAGGTRELAAPAALAYSGAFAKEGVPADSPVRFTVELLAVKPPLPDLNAHPYRVAVLKAGAGETLDCGERGEFAMTLWSAGGKKLYSATKEAPLAFTPGRAEVFMGLEQGVLGMMQGGVRTLVVPPAFQKTMNGENADAKFALPGNETVIVDIEYLP